MKIDILPDMYEQAGKDIKVSNKPDLLIRISYY